MGLPITDVCETAQDRTRVCGDTSSTEMQCLRPLRHLGALFYRTTDVFSLHASMSVACLLYTDQDKEPAGALIINAILSSTFCDLASGSLRHSMACSKGCPLLSLKGLCGLSCGNTLNSSKVGKASLSLSDLTAALNNTYVVCKNQ